MGSSVRAGENPSEGALRRQLNAIKREQFPWMIEVTKCAVQASIQNLGIAFNNFFAKTAKYPRFKKKGKSKDKFSLSNDQFYVKEDRIHLPRIGFVRMRESLRFVGKIVSALRHHRHRESQCRGHG